jgi:hypothetical protein
MIILPIYFFTHVCKEFCVVCSLSIKFPCSCRSSLYKLLGDLRHFSPLIYNERHEPTSRNVIHGFGKLNESKLYKGEETFGYTLLQSSLLCTIEKHTIVHCCSGCYALWRKTFFPLLSPIAWKRQRWKLFQVVKFSFSSGVQTTNHWGAKWIDLLGWVIWAMACKHANLKNTLGYEQGTIGVVCVHVWGY